MYKDPRPSGISTWIVGRGENRLLFLHVFTPSDYANPVIFLSSCQWGGPLQAQMKVKETTTEYIIPKAQRTRV